MTDSQPGWFGPPPLSPLPGSAMSSSSVSSSSAASSSTVILSGSSTVSSASTTSSCDEYSELLSHEQARTTFITSNACPRFINRVPRLVAVGNSGCSDVRQERSKYFEKGILDFPQEMGAVHHHHHNTLESLNSANANGMAGETTTTVIGLRQPNRLFGVDNIGVSAAAIVIANQVNTLSKIERSISISRNALK